MSRTSTETLMTRLAKGDEKAFRMIYDHYWEKLFGICFYFTRSREDTEDLLMGIFSSLWRNREQAAIDNLDAYLAKAAKNQSLKYILRKQRQQDQLLLLKKRMADRKFDHESPEKLLEYKELDHHISGQLQQLPEKTKTIFVLNREKGLTYAEIAKRLGISVKTVEYHISKALALLGKYILLAASLLFFHFFS